MRPGAFQFRVLRPGGELHVLDFGKPHNLYALLVSYLSRWTEELEDNVLGLLPDIFRAAGFLDAAERSRYATLFGTVSLYRACKP
jgi:ubiquinone/menaquinone biosynthesis C-methylase UbiE